MEAKSPNLVFTIFNVYLSVDRYNHDILFIFCLKLDFRIQIYYNIPDHTYLNKWNKAVFFLNTPKY